MHIWASPLEKGTYHKRFRPSMAWYPGFGWNIYSKTCPKQPLKNTQNKGLKDKQ